MWFGDFMSSEQQEHWARMAEEIVEMTSMPESKKVKTEDQSEKVCRIVGHKSIQITSVQNQHQ